MFTRIKLKTITNSVPVVIYYRELRVVRLRKAEMRGATVLYGGIEVVGDSTITVHLLEDGCWEVDVTDYLTIIVRREQCYKNT